MGCTNDRWVLLAWGSMVLIALILPGEILDVRNGGPATTQLMKRLRGSRMSGMMRRRGVSATCYLHCAPGAKLRRQISVCAARNESALRDCALAAGKPATDDYSFCPNDAALASAVRTARFE